MGLFSLFVKSPEDLEKKGDALVLTGKYGFARTEYGRALEKLSGKEAGREPLLARLEEKYASCGEFLARQHLENAAELHDAGIDADARQLLILAGQLTTDDETKEAIGSLLAQLESAMARDGQAWDGDAGQESEENAYSDEEQAFEALCMSLPEAQGDAYMDYGDAFCEGYLALNNGQFVDAEEALDEALEEHGEASYVPLELSAACHNLGKNEKAEALLCLFLSHHPFHSHGVELLCHVYLEEGQPEKALSTLDDNLGSMADVPVELLLLKGRLLAELDQKDASEAWLAGHLERVWDDNIAFALATLKQGLGDAQAARKLLEVSMSRCTGCGKRPPSHIQLTYANLLKDSGDTSVSLIERYLKLAMEDPATASYAYQAVSDIYLTKGDASESERYAAMVK